MICSKLTMYSDTYTYADLFKQPNMRKISLLSILQLMLIACIFDASIRNITNLRFIKSSYPIEDFTTTWAFSSPG